MAGYASPRPALLTPDRAHQAVGWARKMVQMLRLGKRRQKLRPHLYSTPCLDELLARAVRLSIGVLMAETIALAAEARVLEVGCGAGLATVALAERGFAVEAVDTVRDMLRSTKARAASAGVTHRVRAIQASVDHLPYSDNHFSLVLAIGVLPWLACTRKAMVEIIRVTRPGGNIIVNIDNTLRLHQMLDAR